MVMKAVECTVEKRPLPSGKVEEYRANSEEAAAEYDSSGKNMDELVIIVVPRITFDAMEALAVKHGGSVGQVMSTALKMLQVRSEEDEDGA